jgi:hypothetical protein
MSVDDDFDAHYERINRHHAEVHYLRGAPIESPETKLPPLEWVDMSKWDTEPVPERQWAIKDRVPLNQAGLFSGEGARAKASLSL